MFELLYYKEITNTIFWHSLSLSQEAIFRVVAAILHLGNIVFAKGKEIDSSVPKDDQAKFHLRMTADLLMYEFSTNDTTMIHILICSHSFGWNDWILLISGVMLRPWKMHYVSVLWSPRKKL
jgi:hypothetical protein